MNKTGSPPNALARAVYGLALACGLCASLSARADDGAPPSWRAVPASTFVMGTAAGPADERPAHAVTLPAYEISGHEVTNAQYLGFWNATGAAHSPADLTGVEDFGAWPERALRRPRHPVVGVSWAAASAYCSWAGGRLPTEAEWEKAARGHTDRLWPWGDEQDPSRANTSAVDAHATTAPVGSYPAGSSPYGIQDMAGNVAEWVADWHSDSYYSRAPSADPTGPETGRRRVVRGGSWMDSLIVTRAARRLAAPPGMRAAFIGFRIAREAPEQ